MKQRTARKAYTCDSCKIQIEKGQKYVRKSIGVKATSWTVDDRPKHEIPAWAWETVRLPMINCVPCSEAES